MKFLYKIDLADFYRSRTKYRLLKFSLAQKISCRNINKRAVFVVIRMYYERFRNEN